jgi:hypothetical protein
MGSPTVGVTFEQHHLVLIAGGKEHFAPTDDVYTENPMGAYRGLAFAMIFNVLLVLVGAAGWVLWHLPR